MTQGAVAASLRQSSAALALVPALVLSSFAIALNRFAFIDDGATLVQSLYGTFLDNFAIGDSGRVRPFYLLYHWLLVRVLPPEPWAFSLGNAVFLIVAAWQVHWVARCVGGALAGIVAPWVFVLTLSTVENVFTLGKGEPRQLVFWLGTVMLLARALDGTVRRPAGYALAVGACTAGTVLSKETGLLLVLPALVATWFWSRRSRGDGDALRPSLPGLVTFWVVTLLCGAVIATVSLRPGTYPAGVLAGNAAEQSILPLWNEDPHTAVLLIIGTVAGIAVALRRRQVLLWMVLAQFTGLAAFFIAIRSPMLYYYYPAVALAAVLVGVAYADLAARSRWVAAAATAMLIPLLAHGVVQCVWGARALTAWSESYQALSDAVVRARPGRVFFRSPIPEEVPIDARLFWSELYRMPIEVGVLDEAAVPGDDAPTISPHELQRGDWIVERVGSAAVDDVPFRDLNGGRDIDHSLLRPNGQGLLPLRLLSDHSSSFQVPDDQWALLPDQTAAVRWRTFEVVESPRVMLQQLEADYWMKQGARLDLRIERPVQVRLRYTALLPGEAAENTFDVLAGDRVLAECRARSAGMRDCTFGVTVDATNRTAGGWTTLAIRPRTTFVLAELGISPDTRPLSFNFDPLHGGGVFVEPIGGDSSPSGSVP